jgi:hypothetical protein
MCCKKPRDHDETQSKNVTNYNSHSRSDCSGKKWRVMINVIFWNWTTPLTLWGTRWSVSRKIATHI